MDEDTLLFEEQLRPAGRLADCLTTPVSLQALLAWVDQVGVPITPRPNEKSAWTASRQGRRGPDGAQSLGARPD